MGIGCGNGQKERSTMKSSVSLFEKHEIMCYANTILSFSVHFCSEIRAPECPRLHRFASRFQKCPGGHAPQPPRIGLTFCFLDFQYSIPPLRVSKVCKFVKIREKKSWFQQKSCAFCGNSKLTNENKNGTKRWEIASIVAECTRETIWNSYKLKDAIGTLLCQPSFLFGRRRVSSRWFPEAMFKGAQLE